MHTRQPAYEVENAAAAFLAGRWSLRSALYRFRLAFGYERSLRWPLYLARAIFARYGATPPSFDELVRFLAPTVGERLTKAPISRHYACQRTMQPRGAAAQTWPIPALTSTGQLAKWLGLAVEELDWLADVRGWNADHVSERLRHYVCHWQPRRQGRFRLIESPKALLKEAQRRILDTILEHIPPHPAAHGFRKGCSIVTFAEPHVGRRVVLRFDLRDFFPSIPAPRVHALFRTAGYPYQVARLLTGLCTARVPAEMWARRPRSSDDADAHLAVRLLGQHLPQGAPTSPALANLCAQRLDRRLAGLARTVGGNYTRYADDLAFSGGDDLACAVRRFRIAVAVIAAEEGFDLHFRKSRYMHQGVRQQLAGIVVNVRTNLRRSAYDELKAILTNCVRYGPTAQNRHQVSDFRAHLLGRIAHFRMVNPCRAGKLQRLFERVVW